MISACENTDVCGTRIASQASVRSQRYKAYSVRRPASSVYIGGGNKVGQACKIGVVQMSAFVVRAFVRLRRMVTAHKEMVAKLADLERKVASHDSNIRALFQAVRQLMTPPEPKKRKIGFLAKERAARYGLLKKVHT